MAYLVINVPDESLEKIIAAYETRSDLDSLTLLDELVAECEPNDVKHVRVDIVSLQAGLDSESLDEIKAPTF